MAYYDDRYPWAQQHTDNFSVPYQDPVSFSGYESYGVDASYDEYNVYAFHQPESIEHGDYVYGYDYDYDYGNSNCNNWYSTANPTINYLEHNYMEPKLIAYEPIAYSISYSQVNSGFNEPEFEEYDPTPYGGGYDIISAYGKPLPPSDQTCYPRSKPNLIDPKPTPNSESQPEPKFNPNPKPEPKPIATPVPVAEPEPEPEPVHAPVPVREVGERGSEEYSYPNYGYDYPWLEYDRENASGVLGYDYGYGKQVVQNQIAPCEYSPEVVDLCENIFGSWPCLARIRNQQTGIDNNPGVSCPEIGQRNPWEECAKYFFGRPIASYNL